LVSVAVEWIGFGLRTIVGSFAHRFQHRHWLHVPSTAGLKPSAYFPGVLVHDHGSAYARYQCLHAFCNAHRAS